MNKYYAVRDAGFGGGEWNYFNPPILDIIDEVEVNPFMKVATTKEDALRLYLTKRKTELIQIKEMEKLALSHINWAIKELNKIKEDKND